MRGVQTRRRFLMHCAGLAAAALAVALYAAPSLAQEGDISVEVRGIQITGEGLDEGVERIDVFGRGSGTALALLLSNPGGAIIALDTENSSVDAMWDDTGTDLLASNESVVLKAKVGPFNFRGNVPSSGYSISSSGNNAGQDAWIVDISGGGRPAKDAQSVSARGTLALKTASVKETFKQENVALKVGSKVTAGKVPFEITAVGDPQWGEGALEVTLTAKQDCSEIESVKFLDAAGNDIESSPGMSSHMQMGALVIEERGYILDRKVPMATIAVSYWTDMKETKVPFNATAGLGL